MICMSISHGSNGKSLTSSLLVCVRSVDKLNVPRCLFSKTTSAQLGHPCIPHKTSLHNLQARTTKVEPWIRCNLFRIRIRFQHTPYGTAGTEDTPLKVVSLHRGTASLLQTTTRGSWRIWVPRLWWPKTNFDTSHPCFAALNEDCWQNRWKLS